MLVSIGITEETRELFREAAERNQKPIWAIAQDAMKAYAIGFKSTTIPPPGKYTKRGRPPRTKNKPKDLV